MSKKVLSLKCKCETTFCFVEGVTITLPGVLQYILYRDSQSGRVSESSVIPRKGFKFQHGDLIVMGMNRMSGTIYRYDSAQGLFEKGPSNVVACMYCRYGYVFQSCLTGLWYYRSFYGNNTVILGKLFESSFYGVNNVFVQKNEDSFLAVTIVGYKALVELPLWKGYCLHHFLGHYGAFLIGERCSGGFDVITSGGRLYVPRKLCLLKTDSVIGRTSKVLSWDVKAKMFQLLHDGDDVLAAMNLVAEPQRCGGLKLYAFDGGKKRLLAEGDSYFEKEEGFYVGNKFFSRKKKAPLWYELEAEAVCGE